MHIEVQVALNFVISYLYNKLPRRRVNVFGEELERALVDKFLGHWYPERPCRGSAYRCLKTGGHPIDGVLARAARDAGVPVADVLEHLPRDLAVWVDPGEVSYRIGEKGPVKVLFSEGNELDRSDRGEGDRAADREVTRAFNPDAQCFRPVEAAAATTTPAAAAAPATPAPFAPAAPPPPAAAFNAQRTAQPLTFTTATFAQTKFGSTKLKTSSKRANRMSPTEFSNYIKQRAMQQQQMGNGRPISPVAGGAPGGVAGGATGGPTDPAAYFFSGHQYRTFQPRSFDAGGAFATPVPDAFPPAPAPSAARAPSAPAPAERSFPPYQDSQPQFWGGPPQSPPDAKLDSIGLNGSHYPHLLLAN